MSTGLATATQLASPARCVGRVPGAELVGLTCYCPRCNTPGFTRRGACDNYLMSWAGFERLRAQAAAGQMYEGALTEATTFVQVYHAALLVQLGTGIDGKIPLLCELVDSGLGLGQAMAVLRTLPKLNETHPAVMAGP